MIGHRASRLTGGLVIFAAACALVLFTASAAPAAKKHGKNHSKTFERLAGHSLRLTTTSTPPGSVRYDFCRGGGYSYHAYGTVESPCSATRSWSGPS